MIIFGKGWSLVFCVYQAKIVGSDTKYWSLNFYLQNIKAILKYFDFALAAYTNN